MSRFGGDDFVVLLGQVPDHEYAVQVADRIEHAIAAPIELEGFGVSLGASIGVAIASRLDRIDPAGLIRGADEAMYLVKRAGGTRVGVADSGGRARGGRLAAAPAASSL